MGPSYSYREINVDIEHLNYFFPKEPKFSITPSNNDLAI